VHIIRLPEGRPVIFCRCPVFFTRCLVSGLAERLLDKSLSDVGAELERFTWTVDWSRSWILPGVGGGRGHPLFLTHLHCLYVAVVSVCSCLSEIKSKFVVHWRWPTCLPNLLQFGQFNSCENRQLRLQCRLIAPVFVKQDMQKCFACIGQKICLLCRFCSLCAGFMCFSTCRWACSRLFPVSSSCISCALCFHILCIRKEMSQFC